MDYACHQLKPAGLLMLILTSLWGCSALPPGLSQVKIPGSVQEATKDLNEWMSKKFPGGQVRNDDRYCDAHEEPSYAVTDNVLGIMLSQGSQIVQSAARTNFKSLSLSKMDLEKMAKSISNEYLWMPVSFEQTLGDQLHASQVKYNKILDRQGKRNRTLYVKVDAALDSAKKDYTALPYEIKLFIIDSGEINAEALPAGYIYVTRQAANDLDANALQLVLGHEMAHIAKRHTSKQIQQRLVDTALAGEMLHHLMERRSMQDLDKVFAGGRVIQRFNGIFAQYDQGQELQADACSIRGMLSAGADPLKARQEYLRKRGTEETKSSPAPKPFGLSFSQHPEDEDRDRFFQEAYQHHRRKQPPAS
jgi:Zn-dependent protease with chaperone function